MPFKVEKIAEINDQDLVNLRQDMNLITSLKKRSAFIDAVGAGTGNITKLARHANGQLRARDRVSITALFDPSVIKDTEIAGNFMLTEKGRATIRKSIIIKNQLNV